MLKQTSAINWLRIAALIAAGGALAWFVASGLVGAAPASASQNPEIVFSNYGRIVSIHADGSHRKVLTRKHIRVGQRNLGDEILPEGDTKPAVSPDGTRLAFLRDRKTSNPDGFRTQVIVAARDGSAQTVVASYTTQYLQSLEWTQQGRLLISSVADGEVNGQGFSDYTYFTLNAAGGDKQVLMYKRSPHGEYGLSNEFLSFHGLSSDGRVLYIYGNLETRVSELWVRRLETGDEHLVANGVADGAFSPDGNQVVFSTISCELLEKCGDPKLPKPGLWTVDVDGTNAKRLVAGPGDITEPGYSTDGNTIVFASTRNFPSGVDEANEIYSVGADGKCLTWLTNGSPASFDPSWTPEGTDASPSSCGAHQRKPLVEFRPPPARKVDARPRLWAGTNVGGRLLSSVAYLIPGAKWESYSYGDCAYFSPSRCKRPMLVESGPVCGAPFGPTLGIVDIGPIWHPRKVRGSLLISTRHRDGDLGAAIFNSGGANVFIGDDGLGSGRPNTLRDQLLMVRNLRKVGTRKPGRIPGPTVRRQWVEAAKNMRALVKRTGSVKEAAKKLRMSTDEVKLALRLGSTLGSFEDLRTVKCGKSTRPTTPFGLDSGFLARTLSRPTAIDPEATRSPLSKPWGGQ